MVNYLIAAIYGIVQGITEFLPISSSGHLVIMHEFIPLPLENELLFDVALHLATLLAVVWFFRKDIHKMLKSWLLSFSGHHDAYSKLSWLIILATVPAVLAGWQLEAIITHLRRPSVVIIMLIVVGALLILIERISRQTDELKKLNWRKALVVGLAQAFAFIPGTSRSAITIIAGMGTGLKREAALRFSFLLSIPIILGANLKKIPLLYNYGLDAGEWLVLIIAFSLSLISGFLVIKYFLQYAQKNSLVPFAIYRLALAISLIFIIFC